VGPAGGRIFFVKDYYSDGWRYLEAAPADQANGGSVVWFGVSGVVATMRMPRSRQQASNTGSWRISWK